MTPRRTLAAYGLAHVGIFAVEFLVRFHLLKFMTDVVGLRSDLGGYAVALGVVWDAVTDPPMGSLSDRTRTRWGRRRPYILAGGLSLGLAVALLFAPPEIDSQAGRFAFFLASYVLLNTCITIISVPHYALGGELSAVSSERTEGYGWLVFWGQIGSIAGVVLPGAALAATGGAERRAYALAASAVGALVVLTSLATVLGVRERDHLPASAPPQGAFFRSMLAALRNRAFLPLFAMYTTVTIGLSTSAVLALYYYEYRLELSRPQIYTATAAFMGSLCLSLPGWIALSNRLGKKRPALVASLAFGVMAGIGYPIIPPGALAPAFVLSCIGGACGGSLVLLYSLATDIVDYDEALSGRQREGLYFGLWNMGTKFARALAVATTGVLLHRIQFVPNAEQPPEVTRALAWIFGPGAGAFLVLGSILFLWMPPIEHRREQVRRIVEKRRARQRPGGVISPRARS